MLREYIKSLNMKVILYEIFIYKNGEKDIIGWLVENPKNKKIIKISVYNTYKKSYLKRISVLQTVKDILENK